MSTTRGFKGRPRAGAQSRARVPPGQYETRDFPVLTAGPTQHMALEDWTLSIEVAGATLGHWRWADFEALPQTELTTDIHCVTKWSKLDTRWRGVTIDDLFAAIGLREPPTKYVMVRCDGGYSTNLEVVDLVNGRAMIATHFEGEPIPASHGGPARLLVPHLYFWKSAKWVRRIEFVQRNTPGFWESLGYHLRGDPWREQRYGGDDE